MNVRALVVALRPWQWLKNVAVFPALVFGHRAGDAAALWLAGGAFATFCLIASAGYLFNDLLDRERDRAHRGKRLRPLASGLISPAVALATAVLLAAGGLALAGALGPHGVPAHERFIVIPALYLVLGIAYSAWLKRVVLIDVLVIASGFLLRVLGGGVVLGVDVSSWLLVCTFFLALFLALAKRRSELVNEPEGAGARPVLEQYPVAFIDVLIAIVTAALLVSYVLYTVSERTVAEFATRALFYTVPIAFYGIARYLLLVLRGQDAEDPSLMFWRDRPLQVAALVWLGAVLLIVY